ncbi:sporulation related protein [Pontibacter ummariensis]|uniref:Sporulation related domain-containing protein n=1 Tax=Pontibacter ummariensis TaxID=1610492 RepID=A0A239BZ33_9BACT|nr:HU family DNA-binding protein [Pontibacter ummariensis]PRY15549.1 sporulation related protein [Pontibacter ummariensis]SNS12912.1 Sporulation related domain-containing protein [Pontibacter ummariensis]
MVATHIKTLLYDHDCVIIPEFGGLITRYVSARINPVKHTFAPPSKKIAFNEKLVLNDGLLISTIAHQNGITKAEAQQLVAAFVHQAKAHLHAEKRFELSDIGVFRYNEESRLEFEHVESDNMLEASFGLPELTVRPIRVEEPAVLRTLIKERQQEKEPMPVRKRLKRVYNVAAGLALAGFTASALYLLSIQTDYNLGSLNPMVLFSGTYSTAGPVSFNHYAAGYVPVTEAERMSSYKGILPVSAVPVEEEEEWRAMGEELIIPGFATSASINEVYEVEEQASIAAVKEEVAVAQPEVTKPEKPTINTKTGRYYIIAGGYSRQDLAEIGREALSKKGNEAKVLVPYPGSKLYRVSVADFDNATEAQAALTTYRKKYGETLWVLNY